jgi:hypothetical protein
VNWNDGNAIHNGFFDIENSKRCGDTSKKGSFAEIHSGTDTTSVPIAYVAWIALSILAWGSNVALWVKPERVGVCPGVM